MAPPHKIRRRPPRISDVARKAGVSIATVSRSLAQPDLVSEATREKVLSAVSLTGYTPNQAARTLRSGGPNLVLVVVPNLITPFFGELLQSIDQALSKAGYGLLIGNLDDDAGKARRLVELAYGGQVAGAILLNGEVLQGPSGRVGDGTIPAVAVSQPFRNAIPSVLLDEADATEQLANHLFKLGHRKLGYISGYADNPVDIGRWQGLKAAIARRHGPTPIRFEGDFHVISGIQAAKQFSLMQDRPTAMVCSSDDQAMGFISAIRGLGIRVPQDLSVTGFDGIELSKHMAPTLTTIVQPQNEIGDAAVELLADLINGTNQTETRICRGHLRIGASTLAISQ